MRPELAPGEGSGGVDLEGGRALARLREVVDDGGVVAVLGAVAGVRGVEVSLVVHLGETHVVCRAPGLDLPGAGGRGGAEPVGAAAVGGADEDPIAVSHDPDGPGTAEGAVGTARGDPHLLWCGHRACGVAGPGAHVLSCLGMSGMVSRAHDPGGDDAAGGPRPRPEHTRRLLTSVNRRHDQRPSAYCAAAASWRRESRSRAARSTRSGT